ncbi:hypothetical protein AK812_SmicGene33131 [Symbiodinium microadriaticum]|uniref:Uncharacterized protein n=1 Tax=Symbiodinium microadriaticum TaxID=2951 RepID=A0A1Q9CSD8_SYMMI|nr:hypothetical protein AK812_SmicGene33131 [Symbiodinium microadriaticum]
MSSSGTSQDATPVTAPLQLSSADRKLVKQLASVLKGLEADVESHGTQDKEKKFLVMKETVEKCQQLVKQADTDEIDEMSTDEIKAKMIELTSQTTLNHAMLDYCEQKMKTKKTKSKTTTKFNIGFIYKSQNYELEIDVSWVSFQSTP